jgi:hypothetical protein
VSREPIEIGALAYKNVAGFAGQLGTEGLDLGDNKAQIRAVVKYMNAHGGLLGRPIVPVIYEFDSTTTRSYAAIDQEQCSLWTEDHQVFAAVVPSGGDATHIVPQCLNKRGVPMFALSTGNYALKEHFVRWPLLIEPTYLSMERAYRTLIRRLHANKYFAKGAKVGLLRFGQPHWKRVADQVVKPELAKVGVKLTDEFVFSVPQSTPEFANVATQAQSAQLRFLSKGIDHVIIMDVAALIAGQFPVSAESNGYRPRYALTTDSNPNLTAENAPAAQLKGAIGIGWRITDDAEYVRDPTRNGAGAKRCKEMLQAGGQKLDERLFGMNYCDLLLPIQAAVAKGGTLAPGSFTNSLHTLGAGYVPATTFATRFSSSKHDAPSFVRDVAFVESCTCFRFRGGNQPVA